MFEVIVDSLKYVSGVPLELTEAAILAGGVRVGSVVGLVVSPVDDTSNKIILEVRLSEEGQEELIKPGLTIPLEGQGGIYRFSEDWVRYQSQPSTPTDYLEFGLGVKSTIKADKGCF